MEPHVSVVFMAFNEAPHVKDTLLELLQVLEVQDFTSEVLFVDDGSEDDTTDWAKRSVSQASMPTVPVRFLRHEQNRGMGAALKTGASAARGKFVSFLPADGQVLPHAVAALFSEARSASADMVLSVYPQRNDGIHRKVLSAGVRTLIALTHGVSLKSEGPYLFRKELLDPEQFPIDTFFLNFAFPLRAKRAGLRTSTVQVECRPRVAGSSKTANLKTISRVAKDLCTLRARELIAKI